MKKLKKFFNDVRFYIKNTWNEPSNKIVIMLVLSIVTLGTIVYFIERTSLGSQIKTVFDSIWWLFVTISTVGYGDIVPTTVFGKVVGIVTVMTGVVVFSVFSGSIASILVDIRIKERRGLGTVNFKEHIIILGWNQNLEKIIYSIPTFLGNRNFNLVLINDGSEEDYDEIKSKFLGYNIKFVHGDFTKESVLKRANIEFAKTIIILADVYNNKSLDDADERTLLAVLSVKALIPEVKIFAEVIKEEKSKHIKRAGADNVIINGEFNPILIASSLSSPAIPQFLHELIINYENPKIRLIEVPKQFIGKPFQELFLHTRLKTKGIPVAILATKKELTIDDLLSNDSSIDSFIRAKFNEAEEDYFNDGQSEQMVKINPDDSYIIEEVDSLIFVIY